MYSTTEISIVFDQVSGMQKGFTWVLLTYTVWDIVIFIIVFYICNLFNYYYFHVLYCY